MLPPIGGPKTFIGITKKFAFMGWFGAPLNPMTQSISRLLCTVVGDGVRMPPLSKADGVARSTAFGGPAAHVALFQKDIVEKERWMTPEVFTELLALGQCLPGPTSTQVTSHPSCKTHS